MMEKLPKKGKGFAGLQSWIVDNQADLKLAKSSLSTAAPRSAPQVPTIPAAPAVTPAQTPTTQRPLNSRPTPSASTSGQGKSNWTSAVVAALAILFVGWFVVVVTNNPSSSHDDATEIANDAADEAVESVGEPELQPVLAHVVAENANVRSSASGRSPVLTSVPQMSQVMVVGREGSWSKIQTDMSGQRIEGYISSKLLHEGTSEGARAIVCDVANSNRPYSGEVLLQNGSGSHHLTVNAGGQDALVKLRSNGRTDLAFFVRAGESGTVETVADGRYQIMFATGDGFSRKCLEFVTSMNVISDPSTQTFEVTSDGYSEYYSTASYTLTRQTDGNFRPQTEDQGAFRE